MFRPTKFSSPHTAPITVGAAILDTVQQKGTASFTDIEDAVTSWCGKGLPDKHIQEVLVFLYGIGVLDYAEELDAFFSPGNERP